MRINFSNNFIILVPRTVLKERYESAPEEDEVAYDVSDTENDDIGKLDLSET